MFVRPPADEGPSAAVWPPAGEDPQQSLLGEIKVLDLTPRPTHIQGHLSVRIRNTTADSLRIKVLGSSLETVADSYILMGQSELDLAEYSSDPATLVSASVFIPWNLEDIHILAWNDHRPQDLLHKHLSRQEWGALVQSMDTWLYRTAGNDPYYAQWFGEHRVAPFEAERQRGITLPEAPCSASSCRYTRRPPPFSTRWPRRSRRRPTATGSASW